MRGENIRKYGKKENFFLQVYRVDYMESKLSQKYDKKVFVNLYIYF